MVTFTVCRSTHSKSLIVHEARFMDWWEIIAIDQGEEVSRPQDKLLRWWMTSISSPVTWNNEPCWGSTWGFIAACCACLVLTQSLTAPHMRRSSLFVFVPVPSLSRGFCLSSKVMSSWASGGGASSPSGQLISSRTRNSVIEWLYVPTPYRFYFTDRH